MKAPYLIRSKVRQYQNPIEDMNLQFATQKSKFFSKESDIVLLCLADRLGYGNWPEIKKAVRREARCRFDHLFVTRGEEDLKKRVMYLVQSLEKEEIEANRKQENMGPSANLQRENDAAFQEKMDEMLLEVEMETA